MNNTMEVGDHRAVIQFDPEAGKFLREFSGANLRADSVVSLRLEGEASLRVFIEMCTEKRLNLIQNYSGRFVMRPPGDTRIRADETAAACGVSLNRVVQDALSPVQAQSRIATIRHLALFLNAARSYQMA